MSNKIMKLSQLQTVIFNMNPFLYHGILIQLFALSEC